MSFQRRLINVTFQLGEGAFGESGTDTVKLTGLRISAKIIKAGGPSMGTAQLAVYGMTLEKMNRLSTLGMTPTLVRKNTVSIEAGENTGGMTTVFVGTITNAWADFQAAPEVPFIVEAHTGLIEAVKTADVSSYTGATKVEVIMASLASKMGLAFENNGVTAVLRSPYFSGSYRNQAEAVARSAGIEWIIDNQRLAIWPAGQSRGSQVPLVAPPNMVGYPRYNSKGISVTTIFNPAIGFGGKIKVESDLGPANGEWIVYLLDHDLESNMPNGRWFSNISAARPGLVVVQ